MTHINNIIIQSYKYINDYIINIIKFILCESRAVLIFLKRDFNFGLIVYKCIPLKCAKFTKSRIFSLENSLISRIFKQTFISVNNVFGTISLLEYVQH